MVTPFTYNNKIDYPSLNNLIQLFKRCNCDGVFAVCQSSEMFFLSNDEKIELAKYCIEKCNMLGMKCIISGHTHDNISDQVAYLQRLELLNPDAIILVTNRLADINENDDIFIERMNYIISQLKEETRLGLYECPYPYKRLLTNKIIQAIIKTKKFDFIKDTCCDIELIRERLALLDGTCTKLYNANAATLIDSFISGGAGYSGVMLNFIPELFMMLKTYLSKASFNPRQEQAFDIRTAGVIGNYITIASVYEYQNYPNNAKYYLFKKGIFQNDSVRNGKAALSDTQKLEIDALINLSNREISKYNVIDKQELIFEADKFFNNCHASTILPLEDGKVLVAYFAGTREGDSDIGIWLSRRANGVWQVPACIAKTENTAYWNPVLFKSANEIRIVYKVGTRVKEWKSRTMTSKDNGITWSKEVCYTGTYDACGPVRSKPIYMSNNRLLAPNSYETETDWLPIVDISDDGGATFKLLAQVPINIKYPDKPNYMNGKGAIQPTLWESAPGKIHMLLRTTSGDIFRSDSNDYAVTWCEAYNTHLPNNNSGIEIAQNDGDLYLVLNPISGNWASRNPIVLYKSTDNGMTFDLFVTLDCQEHDTITKHIAEFSYPAAVVMDKRLYISYTHMRKQIAFHIIDLK